MAQERAQEPAQRAQDGLGSVQMLRGLAALAVALAHLHAVEKFLGDAKLVGNWALAGFGGVDLFFVISGFVMVWTTAGAQGRADVIPAFLWARISRIYPLWWLVCGTLVAVWLVRPGWVFASHHADAPPDLLTSMLLLPDTTEPLHAVGWTLIHELWFYAVFAVLLLVPARLLPVMLGGWALVVAVAALVMPAPGDPWLKLVRHPLTLEFILGAGVGLAAVRGVFPAPRVLAGAAGLWLVLAALSARADAPVLFAQEWWRVLVFGVPSAALVWGLVGMERAGWRAPVPLVRLGDWSYALYLIHVPVFAALGRLAAPVATPGLGDSLVAVPVALAVAVGAAAVLHHLFERPVLRLAAQMRPLLAGPQARAALAKRAEVRV
jgi:exopolysaccharide production protein ExoZ